MVSETSAHGVGLHVINLAQILSRYGDEVHLIYSPLRLDQSFLDGLNAFSNDYTIPIEIKRNPCIKDLQCIKFIRNYLKKHGPFDILHGHSSKGGALLRLAGIGFPGTKVYTPNALITQDPSLSSRKRTIYGWAEKILGIFTDIFIAVSNEEADEARCLGIPSQKIIVIPNGIAPPNLPDRRAVRSSMHLAEDEIVIGFVGRFFPQKGPEIIIQSMAILVEMFNEQKITLVMLGSGVLQEKLCEMARKLRIASKVRWLGEVPGASQMPAFDILAFPSLYEGMPYVLIEALFAGLPIVTTKVGGANLLVESDVNGYLVPPGDPQSLARALAELINDPGKRARFGGASLKKSQIFTLDNMGTRVRSVYSRFNGSGRRAIQLHHAPDAKCR